MHRSLHTVRHQTHDRALDLGLQRRGIHMLLAREHRFQALARHFVRLIFLLAFGTDLGVARPGSIEEISVDRSRLKRRDGNTLVLQLVPEIF